MGRKHSPETMAKLTDILQNRDRTNHPFRRDVRVIREEREYIDCGTVGGRETAPALETGEGWPARILETVGL